MSSSHNQSTHSPQRTGIVNVNVEPTPTWLVTPIFPPCSSTNLRHSASPSPVPSCFAALVRPGETPRTPPPDPLGQYPPPYRSPRSRPCRRQPVRGPQPGHSPG